MFIFRSKFLRKNPHSGETSWNKQWDDSVYTRRKAKSGVIICVSVIATLFFSIGFLLVILSYFVLRDTRVKPSRIIGFIFAAIGAVLYIPVIQMCVIKWWRPRRRLVADETRETPISSDDNSKRSFLPQSKSNRKTYLEQNEEMPSPKQDERLLGPPTLAQPEVDLITPAGSITFIIDPPPDSAMEQSEPSEGTNFETKAIVTSDDSKDSDEGNETTEENLSTDKTEEESGQKEDK